MSEAALAICEPTPDGVRLFVRVSPRASRDRIEGVERDAAGRARLKVRVTAPPDKGAANEKVTELIARALKIAPSAVSVRQGPASRSKTLEVAGETEELMARIAALTGDAP